MIKANFTQQQFTSFIEKRVANINKQVLRTLQYLGEQCVIEARTNRTFMDQTGNLVSSIGYCILLNGAEVFNGGFDGTAQGQAKGQSVINKIKGKYRTGFALIVVAGMNYAAAVESRGKNVLSSAELFAEKELPKMMKRLSKNTQI